MWYVCFVLQGQVGMEVGGILSETFICFSLKINLGGMGGEEMAITIFIMILPCEI